MTKQNRILLLAVVLFAPLFVKADGGLESNSGLDNTKQNYTKMVDENGNPLEQLLDEIYNGKKIARDSLAIRIPDRSALLVKLFALDATLFITLFPYTLDEKLGKENNPITTLDFKIPFSKNIDSKERRELPFAAYEFVRNAPQDKVVHLTMQPSALTYYNLRKVDAGKYGYVMCYNVDKFSTQNVRCQTAEEFKRSLVWARRDVARDTEERLKEIAKAEDLTK